MLEFKNPILPPGPAAYGRDPACSIGLASPHVPEESPACRIVAGAVKLKMERPTGATQIFGSLGVPERFVGPRNSAAHSKWCAEMLPPYRSHECMNDPAH